jgi:hypothetical protein
MTNPPSPLAIEEFRVLRETIRERGSLRLIVALITFVAWAALAFAAAVWAVFSAIALLPLFVLAAGFEVVFATHVGVERVGRYLQARYETGADLPAWEHAAMALGPKASSGSGIDPLFARLFILATLVNFIPIAVRTAVEGSSLPGAVALELAVYAMLHLLLIWRVVAARRFAANQRLRDLDLFKQSF